MNLKISNLRHYKLSYINLLFDLLYIAYIALYIYAIYTLKRFLESVKIKSFVICSFKKVSFQIAFKDETDTLNLRKTGKWFHKLAAAVIKHLSPYVPVLVYGTQITQVFN